MQAAEGEDVSFRAESSHQAHREVREHRSLTAPFPREKIREMDFNEGHPDRKQRVTNRQARVSVGPAVQNESLGAAGELLNGVHQRALVVGLGEGDPDFEASRFLSYHSFDIGQRPVPVDVRFALAKQIEIRTVEDGDPQGQRFKPLSHSLN